MRHPGENMAMDCEKQIASLAKEIALLSSGTFALQATLSMVLYRISQVDPVLHAAVELGFDDAASSVKKMAISDRKAIYSIDLDKAVHAIEELRTATLRDSGKRRNAA